MIHEFPVRSTQFSTEWARGRFDLFDVQQKFFSWRNHIEQHMFHGKIEQDPTARQRYRVPNLNDWSKQPMQSENQSTTTTNKQCLIVGCQVKTVARGLCDKHYRQAKTQGTLSLIPLRGRPASPKRTCSIDGCSNKFYCKGLCQNHYHAQLRTGNPIILHPHGTPEERFWHHVRKGQIDECWMWQGRRDQNTYGQLSLIGRNVISAHRFSYQLHVGEIANGMMVRHLCNKRGCVNPKHLAIGTQLDNMRDRVAAGRYLQGESNPLAKFSNDLIAEVKIASGTRREIGIRFGISMQHIGEIKRGNRRRQA